MSPASHRLILPLRPVAATPQRSGDTVRSSNNLLENHIQPTKNPFVYPPHSILQLVEDCEEILTPVEEVDSSFQGLWNVLWDAGQLSSCENLNGHYQAAVHDELCDDLPRGLLAFWVSCAFLTLLLLVLVR